MLIRNEMQYYTYAQTLITAILLATTTVTCGLF